MFVEDALQIIATRIERNQLGKVSISDWHCNFIKNVHQYVLNGRPLSTEQSKIIIKLIEKISRHLISIGDMSQKDIDELLFSPTHRRIPYLSSNIKKEARYLGANFIGLRFKFNEMIMKDIRELAEKTDFAIPWFDRSKRIWIIPVIEINLENIRLLISKHRFEIDTTLRDYFLLLSSSRNKESSFIYDEDSCKILSNVCDNEFLSLWIKNIANGDWI